MLFEIFIITVLPLLFLIILFRGEKVFRRHNIDMGGEPPISKTVFVTSKYGILIIWGVTVLAGWGLKMNFIEVPGLVNVISICLWVLGFTILIIGRLEMGKSFRIGSPKEETQLKNSGLFKFSRNPMYVGVYLTILGSILFTLNPVLLLAGIYVIVVHHQIVIAEEKYLLNVFGKEYTDYCRLVRRYI